MTSFEKQTESDLIFPGLALPGLSDFESLSKNLQREREWYADTPRFQTDDEIQSAVQAGKLVELHNSLDVRRIARFDAQLPGFMPFLDRRAWHAVHDFSQIWRDILDENGGVIISPKRLAITSMVRSQYYQDHLVSDGRKLASPDSTHCVGMAFDVDSSAYYNVLKNGATQSVSHPLRATGQATIGHKLQEKFGILDYVITQGGRYDYRVTDAALEAARIMHELGQINLVEEFTGTENSCMHIAVNPDY